MSRLPCGHPEQAVVTDPDGTSYCAVCAGQAFACDNPEADYIDMVARDSAPFAERANQNREVPR